MPKRAEKSTALFDKSGLDDILNTFSSKMPDGVMVAQLILVQFV